MGGWAEFGADAGLWEVIPQVMFVIYPVAVTTLRQAWGYFLSCGA